MTAKILYRPRTSKIWLDITDRVTSLPVWNESLGSEPVTCRFTTVKPIDGSDNYIYPSEGDYVMVTVDDQYSTEPLFHGVIYDPNKYIIGYDSCNDLYLYGFAIDAIEQDFSNNEKFSAYYENSSLATIANNILSIYSKPDVLGGVDINGNVIPKYILRTYNDTVSYFEVSNLTAKEAIYQLCNQNGLYAKLEYRLVPDSINLVNVYTIVSLLGQEGMSPPEDSEWFYGISNSTVQNFITNNLTYDETNGQPEYLPTETDIKLSSDKQSIRNLIKLVVNSIQGRFNLANPDNTSLYLVRHDTTAIISQDTYTLPYSAQDIIFVAQSITSRIQASPAPTTTAFDIDPIAWARIDDGDVCRVRLLGVDYFRKVTKSGTKTLTMKSLVDGVTNLALPSAPDPTLYDNFEIVGNQVISDDNQINYASTGVVKNTRQNEKGQVRFLENSLPPPSERIVIYYIRIEPYKKIYSHTDSIEQYGIKDYTYEVDFLSTPSQLDQIAKLLEQPNPNITLSCKSFRPKIPVKVGWIIPVDITDSSTTDFYQGNLLVYQTSNQLIAYDDSFQSARVVQDVKLQEYRVNLEDIINGLKKDILFYDPNGSINAINKVSESVSIQDIVNYAYNTPTPIIKTYELTLMSYTKIYYRFQEGVSTTIVDSSGNGNNGTILYSSGTPYSWEAGLVGTDTSCLKLDGADNLPSSNACYIQMPYNASLIPEYKFTIRCLFQITDITKYSALLNIYFPNSGYAKYRVIRSSFYPKDSTTMTFMISIFENNNPYRVLTMYCHVPMQTNVNKLLQFAIDFEEDSYNLVLNNVNYAMTVSTNAFPSPYVNLAGISAFTGTINQQEPYLGCQLGIQLEYYGSDKYNSAQIRLIRFAFDVESKRTRTDATTDYNNFF